MQQTGFHLRSPMWETKDLQVSKRVNESFLAKGDIYAYRVSGRAASLKSSSLCKLAFLLLVLKPWGSECDLWRSEVICFTPGCPEATH